MCTLTLLISLGSLLVGELIGEADAGPNQPAAMSAWLPAGSSSRGRHRSIPDVLRLDSRGDGSGCGDRVRMTVNDPPATLLSPEDEGDSERDHGLGATDQPPL